MCPEKKRLLPRCLLVALAATQSLHAAAKPDLERITPVPVTEQIPIADFFRPLLLQQPKLNPSGTHVAAVVTVGDDSHQLLVYDLKTLKAETVGGRGDKDIYSVHWLDDHRLVFRLSLEKLFGVGLFAAEVGSLRKAYPLLQYYYSSLVSVPPKNRLEPLVWNRYDGLESSADHDLGVVSVNTGIANSSFVNLNTGAVTGQEIDRVREDNERHILKRFPAPEKEGLVSYYLADKDGQLAFCVTTNHGVAKLLRFDGGRWLPCPVDLDHIDLIDCGNQPGELVVLGARRDGQPRPLEFLDAATGQPGAILYQDDAYDFYGRGISDGYLYRDPVSQVVLGAGFERAGPQVIWFTEEYRNLQKTLESFFPGQAVRIIGSDDAQKLFLVATFSDRQPQVYSWVDIEKRTAGLIKNSAPWIDPQRMQPQQIIKFKTRDGRRLDAYVTLPAGASKQNLPPLVVLPHGGPWARDSWGFNDEAQFLASRGYAVLQPNYRGSNGYVWMFPEEDQWDFVKMHDDVTDATKALIAKGWIDRERIAIMGTSFGGYLAIAGVADEPDLYRCAVTVAGVFDWENHIRDKKYDQYESAAYGYFMRRLGDPKKNVAKFEAMSPGRRVDRIRVPVFVAGGKEDQVVDIEQSKNLLAGLEKFHVTHESYIVGAEGHGMQHLRREVELYSRIEAFLAKYLAAAKPAAGP